MKIILDIFTHCFFVFGADKVFYDKSFKLHNETRNAISSFWCTLKMTNFKIILGNQHPVQGRLARKTRALIWNFLNCISNTIKDQLGLFLFLKTWKNLCKSTKENVFQDISLPWGFCAWPWDFEIWVKTVALTAKQWDLAGLQNGQTHFKNLAAFVTRFLKRVWPFCDIMH